MTEAERIAMLMKIMDQNEMMMDQNYQILQYLVPMEFIDDFDGQPVTLQ